MNYGIGNVKAKVGGGDAELNIAYGLIPPSDTSKIWVRTDKTPTSVEITTEPTWSDEITTEVVKDNLENITASILCRAGEYVYIIGGLKDGISYNEIRRYNTITNEFETLDVKLPYGVMFCGACCYNDFIYIPYATTYDGTNYYSQPKMLKFNWKTNRIVSTKLYKLNSQVYGYRYNMAGKCANIGNKIVCFGGKYFSDQHFLGASSQSFIYVYSPSTSGFFQDQVFYYDCEKDEFYRATSIGQMQHQNNGMCQSIKKVIVDFSGKISGGYSKNHLIGWAKNQNINNERLDIYFDKEGKGYGQYNILLTTNTKLYICGGSYGTTTTNVALTNAINCYDYNNDTIAPISATLPYSREWDSCQFDCQSSYGLSYQYLVKVENKLSVEENNLVIIPDVENEKKYSLMKVEDVSYEVSINNVYIGNENGKGEMVRCYSYDNVSNKWIGINCDDYIPQNKENISLCSTYYETDGGTSLTNYIVCNVGDLIIASVIARDSGNHNVSDGWTLLGTSQTGQSNQTLSFYYKIATSQVESITITQSTSARIYISMVNFAGKTTATMGTFTINDNANRVDFTLPNKLCVVAGSSNLWNSGTNDWAYYNPNNNNFKNYDVEYYNQTQPRLGVWIDYADGGNRSAGANNGATGNTMIVGYVTIE